MVHCADDTLYTGITNHLTARLDAHNIGKGAKYTQTRRPVALVYWEACDNRSHASQREHQIKQLTRANKLLLLTQYRHEQA